MIKKSRIFFLVLFLFYCHFSGQGQGKNDSDSISGIGYNSDWDFYFSSRNNKPVSIALDLGYQKIAPLKYLPNFVWVSIKMNKPLKDGLCSEDESKLLWQIEDSLFRVFKWHIKTGLVGRLTTDGARDIYYYMGDIYNYDKFIKEVFSKYPNYQFDFGTKPDSGWDFYSKFLYPKPLQYQGIINRRMVDDLDNQGDNLSQPREVFHWIYFKTQNDREIFLSKIKNNGFTVIDKDIDNKYETFPYRLHIKRMDKVDWESVDDYVSYLWQLAKECNGNYDSWETIFQR
jgi:hypothetical protein